MKYYVVADIHGFYLFTLDKVPKNSRYYKVIQERIAKEKKESLFRKRQDRLHSRESAVISCEDEIEKDEERKIRELRKPANTEMENGVTVGVPESYDDEGIIYGEQKLKI